MRILAWHGYLLTGSGSNVYSANTAQAWRAAGHDVLMLCQDRHASRLRFVDAAGEFFLDNETYSVETTGNPAAAGSCVVVRPWIGDVLPVYVYDEYEGFTAKRFVDLTDAELEAYTDRNVVALRSSIAAFDPEVIIVGHEVMGPYIAARATEETDHTYAAKLHGSALEYAVKQQDRYRSFAAAGLNGAYRVIGGSDYMLAEAHEVVPGWWDRGVVVNPGCDVEVFQPRTRAEGSIPTVGYVGKFIASKGVHHLIASATEMTTARARMVIVGYGELDETLRSFARAVHLGDLEVAKRAAAKVDPDPAFVRWIEGLDEPGLERAAGIDFEFTGRLEHGPLSELLPTFDVLVVPSILAEAFGMVAAEAAACGVLPVVPGHSGIGEAGAAVEAAIDRPGSLTYDPGDPIAGIARRVDEIIALGVPERAPLERAAVALARERWSWDHVAARLLEVAAAR